MNKDQLNIILGYLSGINSAYIVLANELSKNNAIEMGSLINNLNKTVEQLDPQQTNNHQALTLALKYLVIGLEGQQEKILTPQDLNLH